METATSASRRWSDTFAAKFGRIASYLITLGVGMLIGAFFHTRDVNEIAQRGAEIVASSVIVVGGAWKTITEAIKVQADTRKALQDLTAATQMELKECKEDREEMKIRIGILESRLGDVESTVNRNPGQAQA